jgi:hypothetical protein
MFARTRTSSFFPQNVVLIWFLADEIKSHIYSHIPNHIFILHAFALYYISCIINYFLCIAKVNSSIAMPLVNIHCKLYPLTTEGKNIPSPEI